MVLLSAPFDPAAAAPPRPPLRPFAQTGGVAALVVALGAASEMLGAAPAGLGRALATGAAHGGLIGLGWLLATSGRPGRSGPGLRLAAVLLLARGARQHRARLAPVPGRPGGAPRSGGAGGRGLLLGPGRIGRVRPPGLERKPAARLPRRARVLRRLPDSRAMIALPLGLVAVLSAVMALTGQGADSVLRHLYLVPTVWVALGWGTVGGGLVGALAGLLHAPVVLPAVERQGITSQTLDGLLSLGLPVLTGLLVGYLADGARARAARLSAVLAIQRRLAEPGPLEAALTGVAQELRLTLGARRVALLVGGDVQTALLASVPVGTLVDPDSAGALTLAAGQPGTSPGPRGDPRPASDPTPQAAPLPGLTLPLASGAGVIGVMAVEWAGELSRATRTAPPG